MIPDQAMSYDNYNNLKLVIITPEGNRVEMLYKRVPLANGEHEWVCDLRD